jgi:MFS family permease
VSASERAAETLRIFGSVLRNADLRRLVLAWTASNLASRASAIAVAVYAYEVDGLDAVGIVAFVRLVAAGAASPWLSVLADRRPRRDVLIGSDLVRVLLLGAMAALVVVDAASLAVYALSVLAAVAEPVFRSAQVAFTPSLVKTPEELTATNVLASGVESVGLFAGPALGALLLVVAGTETVLAATAALTLVSSLLVVRIGERGLPGEAESAARAHTALAGWRAIAAEPSLRVVIALFSVQTFVAGMLNVLVVVLAIEVLDLGTAGVGWLDGMVGIGATLGIVLVAGVAGQRGLARFFALGLLLWSVPLALVAAWPGPVLAFVLMAVLGIGNTLVDVTGVTLMQRSADDAVLGRVFGAFEALVLVTMALGSLATPLLVSLLGTREATLIAGLLLPLVLLPLWRPLRAIDAAAPPPTERVALLRAIPIFEPLAAPELERLAKALGEVTFESGSTVVVEGEHGDDFYVIAGGHAIVEVGGTEVRALEPGDFFGEIALLHDVARTATVRAITQLRVFSLERDVFLATVAADPASAEAAGSIVAARLPRPVIA